MSPTRYGRERIRGGLLHFLLGKGLSSIAGLGILILLVRHLSVPEFAAYSVLQSFIELFTALTGFGLTHATLRYVPELYANEENRVFRTFVVALFSIRLALLSVAILFAYWGGEAIAGLFGLDDWTNVYHAYLAVVWLRVNSHFLFQILESTLHQGLGQAAFVGTVVVKFGLITWLAWGDNLDIQSVIWVEVVSESIGLFILAFGVTRVLHTAHTDKNMQNFIAWWSANERRVLRYGFAGYLQHLAILPYGSAPNRLVAGRFLDVTGTATFGFAQSFADLFRRYLPAQLLGGVIRPVLIARYSTGGSFGEISDVLGFFFRVNTLLLGWVAAILLAVGPEFTAALSGGKYGVNAAWLLLTLVFMLVLESRRFLIELVAQAVERNGLLVAGNLILSSSMPLAILLVDMVGAQAIPIAAVIGLIISSAWITHRLGKDGFVFPFGYRPFFRIVAAVGFAALMGHVTQAWLGWQLGAAATVLVYPIISWMVGATGPDDLRRFGSLRKPSADVADA